MPDDQDRVRGFLADVTRHLAGIFRHMLPGVLVLGGTALAYPEWFQNLDLKSWAHLGVLAVISVAAGNTWFALNRYGLHQIVDYILWRVRSPGPARTNKSLNYIDDLGQYARKSLHTPPQDEYARAREHVAFRASTVLLILTVGELSVLFAFVHSSKSIFEGRTISLLVIAVITLAIGIWQMVITRRIDYYVVNPEVSFMQRDQILTRDKDILGGTPVFTGTRVPVDTLIAHLKAGDPLEKFLADFPSVSREQAVAFLEFAQQLVIQEAVDARSA